MPPGTAHRLSSCTSVLPKSPRHLQPTHAIVSFVHRWTPFLSSHHPPLHTQVNLTTHITHQSGSSSLGPSTTTSASAPPTSTPTVTYNERQDRAQVGTGVNNRTTLRRRSPTSGGEGCANRKLRSAVRSTSSNHILVQVLAQNLGGPVGSRPRAVLCSDRQAQSQPQSQSQFQLQHQHPSRTGFRLLDPSAEFYVVCSTREYSASPPARCLRRSTQTMGQPSSVGEEFQRRGNPKHVRAFSEPPSNAS